MQTSQNVVKVFAELILHICVLQKTTCAKNIVQNFTRLFSSVNCDVA